MTTSERLTLLAQTVQRFAAFNRTNPVQIECYPHTEGDGFSEGELCFEVSAYVGDSARLSCIAKSLDEAMEGALRQMRDRACHLVERANREGRRAAEEADRWRELEQSLSESEA